ncbi:MAG: hypothetical protein KJO13_11935 [Gammaproteobacteria bacterium]|nr:hypothetical protein [Gammaproteobacteria bacterium]
MHITHRIVPLLACSFFVIVTNAHAEPGPEEALRESFTLLADDCDDDCCDQLAGLHSERFLRQTKDAILASLDAGDVNRATLEAEFGANAGSIDDIATLTPREAFARNTCHVIEAMPIEYRYTDFDIIRTEQPAPDKVDYYVRLSGLKASPDMTEEAFYRLMLEDG